MQVLQADWDFFYLWLGWCGKYKDARSPFAEQISGTLAFVVVISMAIDYHSKVLKVVPALKGNTGKEKYINN